MKTRRLGSMGLMVGIVALVVAACGGDGEPSESEGQIVDVERGTIQIAVTATGNVSLPHQASLTFGSAGDVTSVAVEVGDSVREGAVLAALDTDALVLALARAESSLIAAQDALASLTSSAELAKREESVASARSQLQAAEKALLAAETPFSDLDLKKQTEAVADAEFKLQAAQDALDNLTSASESAKREDASRQCPLAAPGRPRGPGQPHQPS